MRKLLLFFLVIFSIDIHVNAQCTGTALNWVNPSFEGTPGTPHVTPPNWDICQPGTTPDTQPGCWGVTLAPSNGISYVGFCNQSGWQEGCSQTLSSPMVPGTTYTFDLDLATTASTGGGLTPGCIQICIYGNMGGNSGCDMSELVWCSGDIYNAPHIDQWVTHTATIVPTQAWTHLLFMSQNLGCTSTPYIMMDNLTPVVPVADVPQFTWSDVCFGSMLVFTDASTSLGTITSWNWDYGDGSPPGSTQNTTHNYAAPGTYNAILTITSTVPCTTSVTHAVTVYSPPVVSAAAAPSAICLGGNSNLTASGASTYTWSPAVGLSATTGNSVTANPTATTTYTVSGTDTNSCSNTNTVTLIVNPNPTPVITVTDATCGLSNGTATVNPAAANYIWNNSQITQSITSLPAGTYDVTITDVNGCTGTAGGIVNNIPGPVVSATSTDEHCGHSDGAASAIATGGTSPVSYLWSNNQNTASISGLSAGSYSVTITDANGCTASTSVLINNIAGPSAPLVNIINETCTSGNGSITCSPSGGLAPYSFVWSNAATTATISNLHSGIYSVTVTDAHNCTAFNTATITDSPSPVLNTSAMAADCGQSDGSATVIATGGVSPYSYSWNSVPPQSTATASNLPDGMYVVTVTDVNGCAVTANAVVTTTNLPTATASSTNEYCDRADGTATVVASGGSGSYSYLWNNGQTFPTATGLVSGTYSVTVNDGFCTASASVVVNYTPGPDAGFSANPTVLTIMDGTVSFLDNSAGNIVNWNWSFGDGSANGSGNELSHKYNNIGTFLVTLIVTDNNGCMDTVSDTIKVKEIFTFYIPSAFSPNGDGYNDSFTPKGINVDPDKFEMYIFDRWGNLIFHTSEWNVTSHQSEEPWNGTKNNSGNYNNVIMDVYVYRILVKEIEGPKHEYIGHINLIP